VACDGRNTEELTNVLGLYMRFVPVRAHFEEDCSFEQILALVNLSLQEATKRQIYFSWDRQSDSLQQDTVPLSFPVSFEYDRWSDAFEAGVLTWTLLDRWSCTEPFVLKLSALQVDPVGLPHRLQLELHYDPQHVAVEQARHLAEMF